jgi:hypothetical protein
MATAADTPIRPNLVFIVWLPCEFATSTVRNLIFDKLQQSCEFDNFLRFIKVATKTRFQSPGGL